MKNKMNFCALQTLQIEELCECRKVGANFLLNIGPQGDENVVIGVGDKAFTNKLPKFDRKVRSVVWMDSKEELDFSQQGDTLSVNFTGYTYGQSYCVRVAEVEFE